MTLLLFCTVVERYDLYAVFETDVKAVVVVNNCTARAKKAMSLINDIIIIDLIIREGLLYCNINGAAAFALISTPLSWLV